MWIYYYNGENNTDEVEQSHNLSGGGPKHPHPPAFHAYPKHGYNVWKGAF